jgi:putative transposase
MILGKKVRLRPTVEQEHQLWKSTGTARWAYNWALGRQAKNYASGGKFLSDNDLRKEITQLKQTEEFSWLNEVSNNIPKQAIKDACGAYGNFFKHLTEKPKYKSRKKSVPSFYNDNIKLKVKKGIILIEKVGWVKTSEQLPIGERYTNPRISFDGKYWYMAVGIEQEQIIEPLTSEVIGIDVGVKELAVCSNGMVFKNINKSQSVKKLEKRLRRLQRKASRKYEVNKEGSRYVKTCNIIKVEEQIRVLRRKLTGIRSNYAHQATTAIAKTKPCRVVVENLNIKGMMKNRHLSKAIAQQKLYDFKLKLKYKCERRGIEFIEADRWFPSSKLCSSCGAIKKDLRLSDRVYRCGCGLMIDRDYNASVNLSRYQLVV